MSETGGGHGEALAAALWAAAERAADAAALGRWSGPDGLPIPAPPTPPADGWLAAPGIAEQPFRIAGRNFRDALRRAARRLARESVPPGRTPQRWASASWNAAALGGVGGVVVEFRSSPAPGAPPAAAQESGVHLAVIAAPRAELPTPVLLDLLSARAEG